MTRRRPIAAKVATRVLITASVLTTSEARAEPEPSGPPKFTMERRVRLRAPTLVKRRIEETV